MDGHSTGTAQRSGLSADPAVQRARRSARDEAGQPTDWPSSAGQLFSQVSEPFRATSAAPEVVQGRATGRLRSPSPHRNVSLPSSPGGGSVLPDLHRVSDDIDRAFAALRRDGQTSQKASQLPASIGLITRIRGLASACFRAYRSGPPSASRRTATPPEARVREDRASWDETDTSHFPPHLSPHLNSKNQLASPAARAPQPSDLNIAGYTGSPDKNDLLLIISERCPESTETYEAAGQYEKALVEIGASFVAGAESFELVKPGEGTLDHPAHLAHSGTVGDTTSSDQRLDAPFP
jgi:hypothetical protein